MGEAKNRGTREERVALAKEKQAQKKAERAERMQNIHKAGCGSKPRLTHALLALASMGEKV